MLAQLQEHFSIIPLSKGKQPLCKWQDAQHSLVRHNITTENGQFTFNGTPCRLGLVCGYGQIEAIDIDAKHDPILANRFISLVKAYAQEIFEKLTVQITMNRGQHWIYRCAEIEPNQKLAYNNEGKEFIETRGVGGLIAIAPSEGYTIVQGSFLDVQTISPEERNTLLNIARQCSVITLKKQVKGKKKQEVKHDKAELEEKKVRDSRPIAKIPYAANLTVKQAKLYSYFLCFKQHNPEGRLLTENYQKNKYWLEKLVNAGWAYREGRAYCLRSYDHVWAMLGIKKAKFHKNESRHFVPFKKDEANEQLDNTKDYVKWLTNRLLEQTASNKRQQMLHVLKTHSPELDKTAFLSVRMVAKMYGFRSPSSGLKYRGQYFDVIPSERKLRRTTKEEYEMWKNKEKHGVEFLYPCDKIRLS